MLMEREFVCVFCSQKKNNCDLSTSNFYFNEYVEYHKIIKFQY